MILEEITDCYKPLTDGTSACHNKGTVEPEPIPFLFTLIMKKPLIITASVVGLLCIGAQLHASGRDVGAANQRRWTNSCVAEASYTYPATQQEIVNCIWSKPKYNN